jgi:hypothetical protein
MSQAFVLSRKDGEEMILKFAVSRDDDWYEAWPDVTLTVGGKLVCVFSQCTHHGNRSATRLMITESTDRGRTWGNKRPFTELTNGRPYWNCARISRLRDGRLVIVADQITKERERGGRRRKLDRSVSNAAARMPLTCIRYVAEQTRPYHISVHAGR